MVVSNKLYYHNGIMSITMKVFLGERLKELRVINGYTQKDVAQKLGINAVTYLHYEKSQRQPTLELLADMAALYDVSIDYLLGIQNT